MDDRRASALPIRGVDWDDLTLTACDGTVLRPYGCDGTWVPAGDLREGTVRYLGSATHGGHIELKALYRLEGGQWRNVLTGRIAPARERGPMFKVGAAPRERRAGAACKAGGAR